PIVPTRLVIAQWKQFCGPNQPCDDASPVVAIRYSAGVLRITQDLRGQRTTLYEHKEDLRNRWLDFRFRIRFTPNATGHIQAWLGDQKLVEFKGATANPEDVTTGFTNPSTFYFKMGLYRDVMPEPMTMYIDEYRKRELRSDEF
ncbi:MAG TPA: heparin lyase I family protein, partial [Terracidiphilus sp.]